MTIKTKCNTRGLRDIKTRSGKVDRVGIPYMAYMNISCLEMEKARRQKEKLSAETRINNINQRLTEIELEKDVLLKKLGERTLQDQSTNSESKTESSNGKVGFRIRY
jgi:hypothetical protein